MRIAFYILGIVILMLASACSNENRETGEACSEKSDCASGYCILENYRGTQTGWSDGYCSNVCTSDSDCAAGNSCQFLGDDNYCLFSCTDSGGCRDGYVCNEYWSVCLPNCNNEGWSCGSELICAEDGSCLTEEEAQTQQQAADGAIGATCLAHEDCQSSICIPSAHPDGNSTFWQEGYCSLICTPQIECPEGSSCQTLLDTSYCLDDCESDSNCREAYVCDTDWNSCLPDCRLGWDCGLQMQCDEQTGICVQLEDGDDDQDSGGPGPGPGGPSN